MLMTVYVKVCYMVTGNDEVRNESSMTVYIDKISVSFCLVVEKFISGCIKVTKNH